MKLSIITINLNNKDGLQRTIDSVISQSFSDFEWIVIDGGSTDGSKEIIEQYSNHFAYWVSEPDTGVFNAMNKGIDHAKGEWIQFLNSGDWLVDCETLSNVFINNIDADVIYGNTFFKYSDHLFYKCYPERLRLSWFALGNNINHQSSFYRHYLFDNNKYDEHFKLCSDWKFDINLICKGKKYYHINQTIVYFDTCGISAKLINIRDKEKLEILNNIIPFHFIEDIEYIKKWNYIEKRRTLLFFHKIFYFNSKLIDSFLCKLEVIKNKIS